MSDAKDDLIARLGPVAWRVKDYADGWIFYIDERRALIEAEIMAGALVEPLYSASAIVSLTEQVEGLTQKNAALAELAQAYGDTADKLASEIWAQEGGLVMARGQWQARAEEAEAEVARLRAENEKMREALEPFAAAADAREKLALWPDIDHWRIVDCELTLGDIRRARASLSNTSEGGKDE